MPRRHGIRFVALIAIPVLAAALFFGGRWVWEAAPEAPEKGGTYIEAVAGRPRYINPLLAHFNEIDQDLVALVFAGLTRPGEDGRIEPDLAREWEISADGTTYTFVLDDRRRWHDGEPVTADDVLLTVQLLQDPAFPGLPEVAAPWQGIQVEKVDERTVRFTLPEPFGPFLEQTTIGLLPAHLLEGTPAAELPGLPFNGKPVGAGPFKVDEVDALQITLVPDPAYPDQGAYLDALAFRFYPSSRAAVTAVVEGAATGSRFVPAEQVEWLEQQGGVSILSAPNYGRSVVLFLNTRQAPFDDKHVRQAVALAIDRERLLQEVPGGGEPAYGPISPRSWGHKSPLSAGAGVEAAKRLLSQTGWEDRDGDGVLDRGGASLSFSIATSDAPERRQVAGFLARALEGIGMKVEVETLPWDEFRDQRLALHNFTAALAEISLTSGDPDVHAFWHSSQAADGLNLSGWQSERADQMLETGRRLWDQEERRKVYAEFQDLFAEEVPAVFLYYPLYRQAIGEQVKGPSLNPLLDPVERFRSFAQWYIATRRVFL